jgi:hypothetical protein
MSDLPNKSSAARLTDRQRADINEAFRLADELGDKLTFPVKDWGTLLAACGGPNTKVTVHGETHTLGEFCHEACAAIERHWLPVTSKQHLARLIYSQMFQYLPHCVASPADDTADRTPDYWRHRGHK